MSDLLLRERELVDRAVNDIQAFSELYEYYFPRVYNYIFARVGEADKADDITSEVFEKIVSKIGSYNSDYGRFSTWVFTIAQNTVTDFYRKKKKNLINLADQFKETSSQSISMDELLILDEDKKILIKCLSLLNDKDRNIISLKFWSELSNQEIANIINKSSNYVAVNIYRTIRRLKTLMIEQQER